MRSRHNLSGKLMDAPDLLEAVGCPVLSCPHHDGTMRVFIESEEQQWGIATVSESVLWGPSIEQSAPPPRGFIDTLSFEAKAALYLSFDLSRDAAELLEEAVSSGLIDAARAAHCAGRELDEAEVMASVGTTPSFAGEDIEQHRAAFIGALALALSDGASAEAGWALEPYKRNGCRCPPLSELPGGVALKIGLILERWRWRQEGWDAMAVAKRKALASSSEGGVTRANAFKPEREAKLQEMHDLIASGSTARGAAHIVARREGRRRDDLDRRTEALRKMWTRYGKSFLGLRRAMSHPQ